MGHLNLTPNSDPLIWPAINDLLGVRLLGGLGHEPEGHSIR
jgi:hypothetical protein